MSDDGAKRAATVNNGKIWHMTHGPHAGKPTICEDGSSISGSAPGYFLVVYCIYFCTMGMTLVPYEALGAELTPGHKDRSTLFATYFAFTIVGILLAILLPGFIADGAPSRVLPAGCVRR